MKDLIIPGEVIAGCVVEGLLVILIPIILLVVWKKKSRVSLRPAVVGMIIFPLFGILLKAVPGYFLLIADNPVSRLINSNVWLYSIIGGGLLAGLFEEGGRFFAFKLLLRKYDSHKDAITYGIGHGGFESAYVGMTVLSYAAMGLMVNTMGVDALLTGLDEASAAAALAQLQSIASGTFAVTAFLGTFERIIAIVFHISLSVIVFMAAREKKYILLFPAAILIHTVANSLIGFVLTGAVSTVALEFIFAAYGAVTAVIAAVLIARRKAGSTEV